MSHLPCLESAVGVSQYSLRFCPQCASADNVSWLQHSTYSWATVLHCTCCDIKWFLCRECFNIRSHYTQFQQLSRHARDSHGQKFARRTRKATSDAAPTPSNFGVETPTYEESTVDTPFDDVDSVDPSPLSGDTVNDHECTGSKLFNPEPSALDVPDMQGLNTASENYFKHEFIAKHGGRAHVVAMSQFQVELYRPSQNIHPSEVQYHLDFCLLVSKLTRGERSLLAKVMQQTVTIATNRLQSSISSSCDGTFKDTAIATTAEQIRCTYVDGKFAMLKNLPHPKVTIVDGHGYVSLRDCVSDILAHGLELDVIRTHSEIPLLVKKLSECKVSQAIYDQGVMSNIVGDDPLVVLYFNEWSDDFDPSSSSTRNNRGSVWMKSVTISPPSHQLHSLQYTYPIAIGKKASSHRKIENLFAAEMLELSSGENNWFYSRSLKKSVRVHIQMMSSLQDQPERRQANCIMLGSGLYSARWGYAANFVEIAPALVSCQDCFHSLLYGTVMPQHCSNCVNWNLLSDSRLLEFSPPENFPLDVLPDESTMLRPKRITYGSLKDAVLRAHTSIVSGVWSVENAQSYLRTEGLNTEAVSDIIECATNVRALNALMENRENFPTDYEAMVRDKQRNPSSYEIWDMPAVWQRGTSLFQHVDAIMHLIFLGVFKTSVKRLEDWLKGRNRTDSFHVFARDTLDSVSSLSLSWCRVLPYKSGKFTGWISENFLAFSRLILWFYAPLASIASDPVPPPSPSRPQDKWSVKENRQWLAQRGLDHTGYALDLRTRVQQYMSRPDGPPLPLGPVGGAVSDVLFMFQALAFMVANVMTPVTSNDIIQSVERSIKIFLTVFEKFDVGLRAVKQKPTWVTSYNFTCLLNLPDLMREYGPLTNLWEGGGQGEKILQMVKPLWLGFRNNWQHSILTRMLNEKALKTMMSSEDIMEEDSSDTDTTTETSSDGMYHTYKDVSQVKHLMRNNKAMSVVFLRSGDSGFIIRTSTGVGFHRLIIGEQVANTMGLLYFRVSCEDRYLSRLLTVENRHTIEQYCIILPELMVTGLPGLGENCGWTILNNKWEMYHGDREFRRPELALDDPK